MVLGPMFYSSENTFIPINPLPSRTGRKARNIEFLIVLEQLVWGSSENGLAKAFHSNYLASPVSRSLESPD